MNYRKCRYCYAAMEPVIQGYDPECFDGKFVLLECTGWGCDATLSMQEGQRDFWTLPTRLGFPWALVA